MAYKDKEKQKAYHAAYYQGNLDKVAAYKEANKEKIAATRAAYRSANKGKIAADMRLRRTGVTQEQYDGAYLKQKGVCAICSNKCISGRRLSADHCHTTGLFRGLLCRQCNVGLGNFRDNLTLMGKAMDYLKETR